MPRKKSLLTGASVAAIISIIFLSPLDDIIIATLIPKFLLNLSWEQSILIGVIIGTIVFVIIELATGED